MESYYLLFTGGLWLPCTYVQEVRYNLGILQVRTCLDGFVSRTRLRDAFQHDSANLQNSRGKWSTTVTSSIAKASPAASTVPVPETKALLTLARVSSRLLYTLTA
jgi:hypothetical protein